MYHYPAAFTGHMIHTHTHIFIHTHIHTHTHTHIHIHIHTYTVRSYHEGDRVVLYDGVCNMCNGWVNMVLDRDKEGQFRFAALQVCVLFVYVYVQCNLYTYVLRPHMKIPSRIGFRYVYYLSMCLCIVQFIHLCA